MRLVALEAEFVSFMPDGVGRVSSLEDADGVMFLCPLCRTHEVLCWFRDRPFVPPDATPGPGRWTATGSGLSDLTLSPSVHLTHGCQWHGWVKDGDAS